MKIIIVGAGIGGTALALALQKMGLQYCLLEQAAEFKEVGAGIQLSPNGVKVLEQLGLAAGLAKFCTTPDLHRYSVWHSGETILTTPLMPKTLDAYGFAYYHAHRADLIDALTNKLDTNNLRLNHKVTDIGQDEQGVWVECDNGERIQGDLLVGADGIHSTVREMFFQPDPPRASGYVTWRGIADSDAIKDLGIPVSAHVDMGPRLSFVYYYVSGGRRFNWLALGQTNDLKRESWSQTASKAEVIEAFDGWYDRPKRVIEATPNIFVTSLHDRQPLTTWTNNRIALMGDAAHAMLPYHAQGAVQSLEDAWVLARTLEQNKSDVPGMLQHYETLRLPRANVLVQQSRNGERWYHLDDPAEVESRNDRFRANNKALDGGFSPQQHWLYSYDAEQAALGSDDEWRSLATWS